jgi:hypothetical protein
MLKNNGKKNKKASNNSSHFVEYYFVELGIAILFIIAAFLFGQQIGQTDILIFAAIIISFFVILPIIIFISVRMINTVSQYFKNKR